MNRFDEYQILAARTAMYPNQGNNLWYPALGLAGEAGEVAEKVKKIYRDQDGKVFLNDIDELRKELGDVLWYVAALATELKISLTFVAEMNIAKLQSRADRGVVSGSGDDR